MQDPRDLDMPGLRDRAVRAARGQAPFDLLITGGTLVDVATSELRPADIGLAGPLIASVHPSGTRHDAAEHLDASGRFIAPGLIDTHVHIESSMVTPRRYAETVVPQGTTTICWDPHELGNVLGLEGVRWAIDAARDLPLRILVLAPSCVPSAPGLERGGAVFEAAEMAEMLAWPEIVGVAEVMDMRGVLDRTPHMAGIVGTGLHSGKLVCGHARGLEGADLQAFAAAGIESDHEVTSGADLLAKLRAGFTVELRGSHDYVLPDAVAALRGLGAPPSTLTLCTDDVFPDELVTSGGMIDVVRRLVRYGLPAIDALRAASLNAALRLGRRDLGLVAPGRRADLIVLSDLNDMAVGEVIVSGQIAARSGGLTEPARADEQALPEPTMRLGPMTADDFRLRVRVDGPVRLRTVVTPRFTSWGELTVQTSNGECVLPPDALLMAVVHRHGHAPPTPVIGVLQDWGCWTGAIATTVAHDSHNLVVFGRDPDDMAVAANALIAAGGGMAVAFGGQVLALLALPVAGLISDIPAKDVAVSFRALRNAADQVADWLPPLRTFKSLVGASLACNPGPHVTDLGIADRTTGEVFETVIAAA